MENPTKTNSFTFVLNGEQQLRLQEELSQERYTPAEVPHTRIAVAGPGCRIQLYKSGKLLIQGKGAKDWVLYTLEPSILLQAGIGYESELNPEWSEPHMGIDESGKGDFFGPLVIASAYVDSGIVQELTELGVKDSKLISSDQKALSMAADIRKVLKGKFALIQIRPETYNKLHLKMGNTNIILAWGHARAIENLLEKVPDCPRAVADKFGPDHRIKSALFEKGAAIKLEQRTKAESDPAVAAASILARAGFLTGLRDLSAEVDGEIPKGASAQVRTRAAELVQTHGPDILSRMVKLHFKTTKQVLEEAGFSQKQIIEFLAPIVREIK